MQTPNATDLDSHRVAVVWKKGKRLRLRQNAQLTRFNNDFQYAFHVICDQRVDHRCLLN